MAQDDKMCTHVYPFLDTINHIGTYEVVVSWWGTMQASCVEQAAVGQERGTETGVEGGGADVGSGWYY